MIKKGDRVKVDFISESRTIYSGKRFTGYGVVDRFEDNRVFGRLEDGTPFMCFEGGVEVLTGRGGGKAMRENFEKLTASSPSYLKLVFQHGERLFIFEDGQYKIAAVQLAWELEQYNQSRVDELQKWVEDLELNIKGAVTFVDLQIEATEQGRDAAIGTQAKNLWSSKLLMLRPIRRVLEQVLKGGVAE